MREKQFLKSDAYSNIYGILWVRVTAKSWSCLAGCNQNNSAFTLHGKQLVSYY